MNTNNSNKKPMRMGMNNSWTISAGGGEMTYRTNNLPVQGMMEALEEALKKKSPLEIENILRAL